MTRAFLVTAVWILACTGEPQQQAEQQSPQPGPSAAVPVRDEQIFSTTMARAQRERLDTLPIGEIIAQVGTWFVGAPYVPATLEPAGPEGLVVNLREFDCVTFVENMLAFGRVIRARQTSFEDFRNTLRTIRYRGGRLEEYPSRLHYFTEWISDNDAKGILANQTRALGGVVDAEPISFMTEHRDSYRQLADDRFFDAIRAREAELNRQPRYIIPEARIAAVAERIRNGDVIAATTNVKGLDVAHTGLAIWREGRLHLMHAPLVGDSVEISEQPLAQRIASIKSQDGIMVARPLEPR